MQRSSRQLIKLVLDKEDDRGDSGSNSYHSFPRRTPSAINLCSLGFFLSDGASPLDRDLASSRFGIAARLGQQPSLEWALGSAEDPEASSTWTVGQALGLDSDEAQVPCWLSSSSAVSSWASTEQAHVVITRACLSGPNTCPFPNPAPR